MELLRRPAAEGPIREYGRPGEGPLQLLGLEVLCLDPGAQHAGAADELERLLVMMGGVCEVAVEGRLWEQVGGRPNVFDGLPHAFYVPRRSGWEVRALESGPVSAAVCSAPARETFAPYLIEPKETVVLSSGRRNWRREVRYFLTPERKADRLIVGETLVPPGNWASSPPHRHERDDPPHECALEEMYLFKFRPAHGFGVQCVYTDDRELEEAILLRDGDAAAIPRGYHPVVAAPGYSMYYLAVLAGDRRVMVPRDDPAHAWLKDAEALVED